MKESTVGFEAARAFCVQHYLNRGYSVEQAESYVPHDQDQVLWLYGTIQEEKERSRHMRIEEIHVAGVTVKKVSPE